MQLKHLVSIPPSFTHPSMRVLAKDATSALAVTDENVVVVGHPDGRMSFFGRDATLLFTVSVAAAANAHNRQASSTAVRALGFAHGVLAAAVLDEVAFFDVDFDTRSASLRARSEPLSAVVDFIVAAGETFDVYTIGGVSAHLDRDGRVAREDSAGESSGAGDDDERASPMLQELQDAFAKLEAVMDKYDDLGAGDSDIYEELAIDFEAMFQGTEIVECHWNLYEGKSEKKLAKARADLDAAGEPLYALFRRAVKEDNDAARAFFGACLGMNAPGEVVDDGLPPPHDELFEGILMSAQTLGDDLVLVPNLGGAAVLVARDVLEKASVLARQYASDVVFDPSGARVFIGKSAGVEVADLTTGKRRVVTDRGPAAYAIDAAGLVLATDDDVVVVRSASGDVVRTVKGASVRAAGRNTPTLGDGVVVALEKNRLVVSDGKGAVLVDHKAPEIDVRGFDVASGLFVVGHKKGTHVFAAGVSEPLCSLQDSLICAQVAGSLIAIDDVDGKAHVLDPRSGQRRKIGAYMVEVGSDGVFYAHDSTGRLVAIDLAQTRTGPAIDDAQVLAACPRGVLVAGRREPWIALYDKATLAPVGDRVTLPAPAQAASFRDDVLAVVCGLTDHIEVFRIVA